MYQDKEKKPLLILVRDDIAQGLATAQACHAAYGFGKNHGDVETNGYVYILRASFKGLHHYQKVFNFEMIPYEAFCEPDMNNELTTIAVSCNPCMVKRLTKY